MDLDSTSFIPPYPARLQKVPWPWERLSLGRQNFIAMWEEVAFHLEFSSERVFFRRTYLCNSPASVRFAFSQNNSSFERKSPQMRYALEPLIGDGLFISDGETWHQRRKIISPLLHASRLHDFAQTMVETAEELSARWKQSPQEYDMLEEMAHLTSEIICRTIFGRNLGREYTSEIVEGFSDYQRAIGQIDLISFLGLPDWFPRWYPASVRRATERIHNVLDRIIADCRARSHENDVSVVRHLIEAKDDKGAPLTDDQIRNEVAVLFMAGHETTANTLAWAWYLISQSPETEQRLHTEIDDVLGERLPTLNDLPRLSFTRAILDETLRLYPPVPILPREALEDEEFNGERIRKGSLLFVVPWLLHRHKKWWTQPDHFRPQRFLHGSSEPISKYAYVPFSIGPRVCAGMSFGLTEAILCIATIARQFRLVLRPGFVPEPVCRLTLRPSNGMPMTAYFRGRNAVGMQRNAEPFTAAGNKCPFLHY